MNMNDRKDNADGQNMVLNTQGSDAALKAIQQAMPDPIIMQPSLSQPIPLRLSDLASAPLTDASNDLVDVLDRIHELSNVSPILALDHVLGVSISLNMALLKNYGPAALEHSKAWAEKSESKGAPQELDKSHGRLISSICRTQESIVKLMAGRVKVRDEMERRGLKQQPDNPLPCGGV